MPFDLTIGFFGLVMLCASPDPSVCPEGPMAYFVESPKPPNRLEICGEEVEIPEHAARLSFRLEDSDPDAVTEQGPWPYELVPDPERNGLLGVIDLEGKDLCLKASPSSSGRMAREGHLRPGQRAPSLWRKDRHAYGWVASFSKMKDHAGDRQPLCPLVAEIRESAAETTLLSAKVGLPIGRLSSAVLGRKNDGKFRVWDLSRGSTYREFQALAEDARLEVEGIESLSIVRCEQPQRVLAKLKDTDKDGEVYLRLSNSPRHEAFHRAEEGAPLTHFYAFYQLIDDRADGSCTQGCLVPQTPSSESDSPFNGSGTFCPPSSYP